MRQRWFSRRALILHLGVLVWSPGCVFAGWWQVTRALGGNDLSYLYSVEWPVFAIVGVWAWWALIHTDPDAVGQKALACRRAELATPENPAEPTLPPRDVEHEDPELAAYNDRLAALAGKGPQTWRNR